MSLPLTSGLLFPSSPSPEVSPPTGTQRWERTHRHTCRRLNSDPQKSQALSLGPINLTLFGKRIFADGIQVRDLDTGDCHGYMGGF